MTAGLGETFPELVDWFRDAAPVGRLGVPQDLSPTVCHLLSDAGSFISGSDILITGMLMRTYTRLHPLTFCQVVFMREGWII